MANRYETLARGHGPGLDHTEAATRLDEAREDQMQVREVIAGMQEAHPGLGYRWETVLDVITSRQPVHGAPALVSIVESLALIIASSRRVLPHDVRWIVLIYLKLLFPLIY